MDKLKHLRGTIFHGSGIPGKMEDLTHNYAR